MYTDLTYINLSMDASLPRIIVLQKNLGQGDTHPLIAWKVIRNCGYEWSHPIRFDWGLSLGLSDIHGNESPRVSLEGKGVQHQMCSGTDGGVIVKAGPGQMEISVSNRTSRESYTARIYRSGCLLAVRPRVLPGETVNFHFNNTILIGTGLRVSQGQPLHPGRLSDFKTQMDLSGLKKARILMLGGGPGPGSKPLRFFLEGREKW